MTEPTRWGKSLREAREAADHSQTELARISGIGQKTISDIETGDVKAPGFETLARLARALGVPAEDLFPLDDVEVAS